MFHASSPGDGNDCQGQAFDNFGIYDRRNFVNGTENGIEPIGTMKRNLVSIIEIWCECFGKEKADLRPKDSRENP